MEFSMALNRSPANMETEEVGKTIAYTRVLGSRRGGGRSIFTVHFVSVRHPVISHNTIHVWIGRNYYGHPGFWGSNNRK